MGGRVLPMEVIKRLKLAFTGVLVVLLITASVGLYIEHTKRVHQAEVLKGAQADLDAYKAVLQEQRAEVVRANATAVRQSTQKAEVLKEVQKEVQHVRTGSNVSTVADLEWLRSIRQKGNTAIESAGNP